MANPKSTQMWFVKAQEDLKVILHLPLSPDFLSIVVFHSQQCAEKAIKGFLTYNNVRVLKTHNMNELLKSLSQVDPILASKYSALTSFTPYAVEYRYPDVDFKLTPLSEAVCENAIDLAKQIVEELSALVGPKLPFE